MKKTLISFLLFTLLVFPSGLSAHAIGQPPYFKVNGIYTDYYPVPTTSAPDFIIPEDIANGLFLVNEVIEFEIDTNNLPVPREVIDKTKFIWEYGDGTTAEGLKNSHIYTKPGTYFLDIKADSGQGFEPLILQSTAINIVPNKDYRLPKAVIEVNGQQAEDPLLDIIDVNFSGKQKFSALKSDPGSSEIVRYEWDLGDQQTAEGKEIIYAYTNNPYTVFPVLRIRTPDGFIVDSFIQIKDENAFSEDKGLTGDFQKKTGMDWKVVAGGILLSVMLAGILTFVIAKFLSKKNKSAPKK